MDGMEALKSAGVTNFKVFSLSHMEQFLLAGPVVVVIGAYPGWISKVDGCWLLAG